MQCLQSKVNHQPSARCSEISLLGFVRLTFDMTMCLLDVDGKRAVPVTFLVCHLYMHTLTCN